LGEWHSFGGFSTVLKPALGDHLEEGDGSAGFLLAPLPRLFPKRNNKLETQF